MQVHFFFLDTPVITMRHVLWTNMADPPVEARVAQLLFYPLPLRKDVKHGHQTATSLLGAVKLY